LKYYIGCSGWSYSAWRGPFYPTHHIENSDWLPYYSKVFDFVEIDSSFYSIPNPFTVKSWYNRTPDNFRFAAKFPKVITHDKRLKKDSENELNYFFKSISGLRQKILALLIQLPPSLGIIEGLANLREIVPLLDRNYRYAVEVRDRSWFQDLAYNFFANNNICLAWSQLTEIRTPPVVTTDFLYLRLIGDRTIPEKDFGKIQKDRDSEMKRWANYLKRVEKGEKKKPRSSNNTDVNLAIVSANNHYAGFGPGTANTFRKMIGLSEARWEDKEISKGPPSSLLLSEKQKTLSDF
jgi:uncharacterized protein YecE (DUF72 family)